MRPSPLCPCGPASAFSDIGRSHLAAAQLKRQRRISDIPPQRKVVPSYPSAARAAAVAADCRSAPAFALVLIFRLDLRSRAVELRPALHVGWLTALSAIRLALGVLLRPRVVRPAWLRIQRSQRQPNSRTARTTKACGYPCLQEAYRALAGLAPLGGACSGYPLFEALTRQCSLLAVC
jgi:hypothetical protein